MWSEIISKIENMKGRIQVEIENLKQKVREREREKAELWSGAFWLWFLFWPVLAYKVIKKLNRGSKLDMEIRELRDRIQELEREVDRERWEKEK